MGQAKHFTFAQLTKLEVWQSTASSDHTIHSSTRTISSVIGVAILTTPLLRISTVLKIQLMLNEKLLLLTHLVFMDHLQNMQQLPPKLEINQLGKLQKHQNHLKSFYNSHQSWKCRVKQPP